PSAAVPTLRGAGDAASGRLRLIDQTLLPAECREIECDTPAAVWDAIHALRVRGAPAIGVAAAYGVVLGAQADADGDAGELLAAVESTTALLETSRPTAVNLFWALARMRRVARES